MNLERFPLSKKAGVLFPSITKITDDRAISPKKRFKLVTPLKFKENKCMLGLSSFHVHVTVFNKFRKIID